MNKDTLTSLLQRCGYRLDSTWQAMEVRRCTQTRDNAIEPIMYITNDFMHSVLTPTSLIAMLKQHDSNGQDYVQHRCGYPLLRAVAGNVTMHYQYRDVQHGPDSQPLTVCPSCRGVLDIGTIQEVRIEASVERMMQEYKSDLDYLKDK